MLDAGMGVEFLQYPPGTHSNINSDLRGDQQSQRDCEHHEESYQVPSGQFKRYQRLYRYHRCPQLRAGSLRLPGAWDFRKIRDLREFPTELIGADVSPRCIGRNLHQYLPFTHLGTIEVNFRSVRSKFEEFVGCIRLSSPLGSIQWLVYQRIDQQQSMLKKEKSTHRRSQWKIHSLQHPLRLLHIRVPTTLGNYNLYLVKN